MTEKKEAKESPIISLEVVTALSIMKGDFKSGEAFASSGGKI